MNFPDFVNELQLWLARIAALSAAATLFVPLWAFRRLDRRAREYTSGRLASVLRWPFLLVMTALFIAAGVLLWQPVPLALSPLWRMVALTGGSLLYFPGLALYLWGLKTLGDSFGLSSGFGATLYTGHRLIQNGPYRYIRHPMYEAVICAALGALLIYRTWATVAFLPISFGLIIRARREDKLLETAYREEWQDYQRRVPGWFPKRRSSWQN